MTVASIYYEDQRGPRTTFALHEFVLAIIYDSVDGDRWRLAKEVRGYPMKGAQKLLAANFSANEPAFKLFDNDEIRRQLGLAKTVPDQEVLDAIRARENQPENLHPILLRENLESVLRAVAACAGIPETRIAGALGKDLEERDLFLSKIAWAEDTAVRDFVVLRISALAQLKTAVSTVVVAARAKR